MSDMDWGAALAVEPSSVYAFNLLHGPVVDGADAGMVESQRPGAGTPAGASYLPVDVWSERNEIASYNRQMFDALVEETESFNEEQAGSLAKAMKDRADAIAEAQRVYIAEQRAEQAAAQGERYSVLEGAEKFAGVRSEEREFAARMPANQRGSSPRASNGFGGDPGNVGPSVGYGSGGAPRPEYQGTADPAAARREGAMESRYSRMTPSQQAAAAKAARRQRANEKYARQRAQIVQAMKSGVVNPKSYYTFSGPDYEQSVLPFVNKDVAKQFGIRTGFQAPEYSAENQSMSDPKRGARATVDSMSPEELAQFRSRAVGKGLYDPGTPLTVLAGPGDYETMAKLMAVSNVTAYQDWRQVLAGVVNPTTGGGGYISGGGGGGGGGGGPTNTTQRVFNKTSVDQGRGMLRSLMAEMLGRAPTDDEVRRYTATLNRKESKTPQIVTTAYSGGGSSVTTRTIANAPEPDEVLRGEIEDVNEEEMERYAANGYMDVLNQMVGG